MPLIFPILAQITATDGQHDVYVVFAACWIVLGISSFLFFHFNKNTTLKRHVFPPFVVIMGIIFGCFIAYMSPDYPQILFIAVPMIVLISFLNIRKTRFCDVCGRTLYQQPVFSRSQFCPRCGAELK
jgi:hypothetical protein